jgi:aromatic ring hydroxylase
MDKEFLEYLKDERNRFVKAAVKYDTHEHNELRTAIDSLLIAYDQAREKLNQPLVVNSLLENFPENRPLYKDSGLWQMRTDDMEDVLIQQEYMESDESFMQRCKAINLV